MRFLYTNQAISLVICLVLVFMIGTTISCAQHPTKIAGKIASVYTKEERMDIGDTEKHTVILAKSEGTNESIGKVVYMDGAQVININFSDVIKGNGDHQGYIILAKNSDTTFAKYNGHVSTTMSPDNIPITSFEGTFSYIGGKGKFAGITGTGTYSGKFTSKNEYTVEWQSEYSLKK